MPASMEAASGILQESYRRDGYIKVTYPELRPWIAQAMEHVRRVEAMERPPSWTYQTVNNSLFFKQFIFGLPAPVFETAFELLGSVNLGTISPAFRMDRPGDDEHLRTWHQDSNYFLETESGDTAMVLWVPMVPATLDNGTIAVCPGSHTRGRLGSSYQPPDGDASEQFTVPDEEVFKYDRVRIEAAPGDVLYVHMDLIHGSMPNRSTDTRYTAQLRLAAFDDPTYSPVQLRPKYDVKR